MKVIFIILVSLISIGGIMINLSVISKVYKKLKSGSYPRAEVSHVIIGQSIILLFLLCAAGTMIYLILNQ